MIVLKANPEMEATFQKLIQTTGERVKWNGNFVVIGNYLILHGENRSLFFNFDNRKVVSNFIELSINEDDVIDIKEYPKIQNIINMLLYAFGKWGTVKGLKVEKSESELNLLFVTILKEIGVEPDYSWLKFRFLKDGILITYEDVIQLAIEEKENPLKEMEESEQEKEGLWHSLVWKRCHRAFTKDEISEEQRNENRIGFNFYMVGYRCPRCSSNLHMIVFPEDIDDGVIERMGTKIDAIISSELLLTIFFNKTPLHDGAVIIADNKIKYAGAILPVSQTQLQWKYGTRHRAALGMSEMSKATVLVVSEETGDISLAEKGNIKKYDDIKKVKNKLEKILIK